MIKNLIFSASGSKIFIHLGFLKCLSDNNLLENVNTFVGCSGGSIMSLIIALGYNLDTITELFLKLDSEKLKKIDTDSVLNFFENYGLDCGNNLERALRIILKTKHNQDRITFKELYEKYGNRLIVSSVNLQKHQEEYFDYTNNPHMDVIDAVLMSLSIPIMFSPRDFNGDLYVDGGIICPYPIEILEIDKTLKRDETLGIVMSPQYYINKDNVDYEFVFCDKDLVHRVDINSFEKYLFSVLSCGSIKLLKERYEKYKDITVLVVNDQNGLIFEVTRELREELIKEGYNYTDRFLKMKRRKEEELKEVEENTNANTKKNIDEKKVSITDSDSGSDTELDSNKNTENISNDDDKNINQKEEENDTLKHIESDKN